MTTDPSGFRAPSRNRFPLFATRALGRRPMDVGDWLRSLGLGQYLAVFREHAIDAEVLPDLTESGPGEVRRAVGAPQASHQGDRGIREPRREHAEPAAEPRGCAVPRPPPSAARSQSCSAISSARPAFGREARRRGLAQSRQRLSRRGLGGGDRAWRARAEEARRRADGAVRLSAQRRRTTPSARCARRSRSSARLSKSTPETPAEARRSFPRGSALIPGRWWSTQRAKCSAMRPISPRASRAPPSRARSSITAAVQRQTAGLFVAEDRGQHELKGVSAPMTLYRIVRASGGGRRGGARALTPLVGREEELDLLARRWERAQRGEGQLALIVGEPGLGKSQADGGVSRPPRRDAAHLGRMVVVATVAEHAAASDRRMGPPALRRGPARRTAPGRPREHAAV